MPNRLLYAALVLFAATLEAQALIRFFWNESVEVERYINATRAERKSKYRGPPFADVLLDGTPVYVSMTTISSRLQIAIKTIQYVISGTHVPTELYLFVSREPYLLDSGITDEQLMKPAYGLINLLDKYPFVKVVYTQNVASHRKLLPLLQSKW